MNFVSGSGAVPRPKGFKVANRHLGRRGNLPDCLPELEFIS